MTSPDQGAERPTVPPAHQHRLAPDAGWPVWLGVTLACLLVLALLFGGVL